MKTIREWLEALPPDIRERALANVKAQRRGRTLASKQPDLEDAILTLFIWHVTPEGFRYWNDVSKGKTPKIKAKSKC